MRAATISLLVCYAFLALVHFAYYPKWQQPGSEATLSYDVSGYYLYLPATFIYRDLKQVAFLDDVIEQYHPTYSPYQVFTHESGNQVMKYSVGQAVLYAPAFAVAHAWASWSDAYPADGFSRPYQLLISLSSLLVSFLGLYWLMILLRAYFREGAVALTLLCVVCGTNYLNYSAIDGAMTHNHVFTLAALLLLTVHRFYVRATWTRALLIGGCVGLMALTRPTEIIVAIIPLLWGLEVWRRDAWRERWRFLGQHRAKLLAAVLLTLAIGSLQLIYWKYVSGDWLVYSYQDQGFDWFKAHIHDGLFSYKAGWLVYTPLMAFSVVGFINLFRQRPALFSALFLHAVLFVYVAFAWSVWWYGGSLGQRTMVQEYVVLSFPLAAFLSWVFWPQRKYEQGARPQVQSPWWSKGLRVLVAGALLLFTWHNLWFTHQAHRGRLFVTEQMTETYFWRTLYTFGVNHEDRLALDTPEFFRRTPSRTDTLYANDFEDQSTTACGLDPITGQGSLCLVADAQITPEFAVSIDLPPRTWVRASVDCRIRTPRSSKDNSAQMVLLFRRKGEEVKRRLIRLHRVLNHDFERRMQIDAKVPDEGADEVVVLFWNGGASQPALVLDNLWVASMSKD